ncbi:MAG: orotidine 5'-phosphate decarboxylase [Candidatus Vogelbacteria bacterium]|nr:orotidine 5'-phosphate decarboxylase [Candidatus Vogelbacteria bacterium]
MSIHVKSKLNYKKKYLQVALNNTLADAIQIISVLPPSDRIIIEAGTPFIKHYGVNGIRQIVSLWAEKVDDPYIVADLKTMDRAETEVGMAAEAGASAVIALGHAPIETLDSFIDECERRGLDSMIDMMNVEYPLGVLSQLRKPPVVVVLHRGVDEEKFNREKMIPLHEIRRIKGRYNIMISIAGGDTIREVQSSVFNDADIVVIWKQVYSGVDTTLEIINDFLDEVK